MKFRTRMIATTAAAAFLVTPFLFAAEDSTNSSSNTTSVNYAVTPEAGYAEVPAMLMAAQSAASSPSSGRIYKSYPRAELFLGYSYIRGVPTLSPGNRMDYLNGGSTSIAFNLNRTLGLIGDFGGYDASELQLTGAGANPARVANASGTAYTFMAGPRLSFRHDRITPFIQVLFGGIHASQVTLSNCTGALCTPLPTENSFAMTAGGGIDLNIHRHLAIRVVQAEYLMTNFADLSTGNRDTQNDLRLSSGLVFGFGGNTPLPAIAYSCTLNPSTAFPGDPITATGVAMNLNPNPKKVVAYTWITDGGTISGTTNVANLDTSSAAPGTYTVRGHVSQGVKPSQMADCSTQFTVRAFIPPTVSCSANPASVNPGDSSTISANAVSPQNRPLTYSYNATAGSISGTAPSTMLSTTGAAPGPITVTCGVADDKGHNVSGTTSVNVIAPPPPPPPPPPAAPLASSMCTVSFERDVTRPTRVDNEAKACLDDIALNLQRSTDAKLALVGNEDTKEVAMQAKRKHPEQNPSDAAQRAVNTKQYLVNEKGIDTSRIMLYTGSDDAKTVTTTLIPVGAVNPVASNTPVD